MDWEAALESEVVDCDAGVEIAFVVGFLSGCEIEAPASLGLPSVPCVVALLPQTRTSLAVILCPGRAILALAILFGRCSLALLCTLALVFPVAKGGVTGFSASVRAFD